MKERMLALLFTILAVVGWWIADVSVIQMSTTGFVTNGFWNMSADKSYHLGMFLSIGAIMGLGFLAVRR